VNSKDLRTQGFRDWMVFHHDHLDELIKMLPTTAGVYVIRRKGKPFGRFDGKSDIVYIGRASESHPLRRRIRQYFSPGPSQATNWRVHEQILSKEGFQISWIGCASTSQAEKLEARLLRECEKVHGEFPPLNRRRS